MIVQNAEKMIGALRNRSTDSYGLLFMQCRKGKLICVQRPAKHQQAYDCPSPTHIVARGSY